MEDINFDYFDCVHTNTNFCPVEDVWEVDLSENQIYPGSPCTYCQNYEFCSGYLSGKYLSGKFPCESEDDAVRQKYGNVSVCVICDEHRNKCRKCAYKNERVNLFPCEMCEKEKYCGGIRFAKARPDRRLTCFRMLEG